MVINTKITVADSCTTFAHNIVLLSINDLIHIKDKIGLLHEYTSLIQHTKKENCVMAEYLSTNEMKTRDFM